VLVSLLAFRFCLFAVGVRERTWVRESGGRSRRSSLSARGPSVRSFRLPRGTSSCFLSPLPARSLFLYCFSSVTFQYQSSSALQRNAPRASTVSGREGDCLTLKQSREAPGLIEILRREKEQKDASLAAAAKEPISTKCVCICHFERGK